MNPWENYLLTVSYKLKSRLGDKKDLKNLIYEYRKKGIRIYAQLAINQMTYEGNDIYEEHSNDCSINPRWPGKNGTTGSPFFTVLIRRFKNVYTGEVPIFEYPSVPYCGTDIFCKSDAASNYFSGWVNNGMLEVNTYDNYARQRIADFLTELMCLGIAGYSIHNGKYIQSVIMLKFFFNLKNNLGEGKFPDDFIIILEMDFKIYNDLFCNYNNDENFSNKFTQKLRDKFGKDDDVNKINSIRILSKL